MDNIILQAVGLLNPASVNTVLQQWSQLLLYTSIIGGIIQCISYFTGLDLWGKFIKWRDSKYFYLEIDTQHNNRVYNQLLSFLSNYPSLTKEMNYACLGTDGKFDKGEFSFSEEGEQYLEKAAQSVLGKSKPLSFGPGFGQLSFLFELNKKKYRIWIDHRKPERAGFGSRVETSQTISLTIAFKHKLILIELLEQAAKTYTDLLHNKVCVYTRSNDYWRNFDYSIKNPRPLEKVVLAKEAQALVDDAIAYFRPNTKKFYESMAIPYRRGYLLFGKPGNGKTSFTQCLATYTQKSIYFLSLNDKRMDDTELQRLIAAIPTGCIILLEDIDCLFGKVRSVDDEDENKDKDKDKEKSSSNKDDDDKCSITLSGLLNALDGICASEGSLVIMTSNHPENLDPALTRTGRIDIQVEFTLPNIMLAQQLAAKLFRLEDYCAVKNIDLNTDYSKIENEMKYLEESNEVSDLLAKFRHIFHEKQYKNSLNTPFVSFSDIQGCFLKSHVSMNCACIIHENDNSLFVNSEYLALSCLKKFIENIKNLQPSNFKEKKKFKDKLDKNNENKDVKDSNSIATTTPVTETIAASTTITPTPSTETKTCTNITINHINVTADNKKISSVTDPNLTLVQSDLAALHTILANLLKEKDENLINIPNNIREINSGVSDKELQIR